MRQAYKVLLVTSQRALHQVRQADGEQQASGDACRLSLAREREQGRACVACTMSDLSKDGMHERCGRDAGGVREGCVRDARGMHEGCMRDA